MDPYIGEIRIFPYTYYPNGWLECDGQLCSIALYQALSVIVGFRWGGDGKTTFAVPDLRGYAPVGMGQGSGLQNTYALGYPVGQSAVTLASATQLPAHSHTITARLGKNAPPDGNAVFLAKPAGADPGDLLTRVSATANYTIVKSFDPAAGGYLALNSLAASGQPAPTAHENRQPFLTMRFCICYNGVFPVKPA